MIQIIFFLIALWLAYLLLKKLLHLSGQIISWIFIAVLAPPAMVGYCVERCLSWSGSRLGGAWLAAIASIAVTALWGFFGHHLFFEPGSFGSLKYLPAALLYVPMLVQFRRRQALIGRHFQLDFAWVRTDTFFQLLFGSLFMFATSAYLPLVFDRLQLDYPLVAFLIGIAYWAVALLMQLYALMFESSFRGLVSKLLELFEYADKLECNAVFFDSLEKEFSVLNADGVRLAFDGVAANLIRSGALIERQLDQTSWLFRKDFFEAAIGNVQEKLGARLKTRPEDVAATVKQCLNLPAECSRTFASQHLDFGDYYDFEDASYFVAFKHATLVRVCPCCGLAEQVTGAARSSPYCSETCARTERACQVIRDESIAKYIADATTAGFSLIQGGAAWAANHKVVAAGGQGHGFAAEKANTRIDIVEGRSAKVVGDNNAKNGADRIVSGVEIQTKYCDTGVRSVGAAFDNKAGGEGLFKYYDSAGAPMSIEVPKDQYDSAVREMRSRIAKGKVPGVSNSDQAESLIRKGHLTYQQAVNITKFGTFESLVYDVTEGAIIGTAAGGISFCITATLYYIQTHDAREALKIAALEAGKTFGKALAVYVVAQQLHRLSMVQSAVAWIDIGSMSPTVREAVQHGLGAKSTNAANRALGGTAVTGAALIAVTTGPDLIKMVDGRISGAQLVKNVAVTASAVAGSSIGAIAGGALGASLGPVGVFVGQLVGGAIGGGFGASAANDISKSYMKDDAEVVMEIVTVQVAYLSRTFVLSGIEMECLAKNLQVALTPNVLEYIYQAKTKRRAMANFFIKPLVVGAIKQRPALQYNASDVMDACTELTR